jgi:segregation and condensation protein B
MNTESPRKVLEAGLMAAGRTLSLAELAQLFDEVDRPSNEQLREALAELAASWEDRAVELKETAAGFRVQVRREFAEQVSRLWPERPPRYSRALLETLAIIAYRQPLTRGEIESVRGVAVNPNIIRTLFERNWIRVVGHREVPGRPELLGTTRDFLDYFGLKSLDQLPPLSEIKSLEELDPQLALPEPVGAVALPAPSEDVGESADGQAGEAAGEETADATAGEEDASGEQAVESGEEAGGTEQPEAGEDAGSAGAGEHEASAADAAPAEEPAAAAPAEVEDGTGQDGAPAHEAAS